MLAAKEELQSAGRWQVEPQMMLLSNLPFYFLKGQTAECAAWAAISHADFRGKSFNDSVVFESALFPGIADFDRARFTKINEFLCTHFEAIATFNGATFKETTSFQRTIFNSKADFEGSSFGQEAIFFAAQFKHDANFENSNFSNQAIFEAVTFSKDTKFSSATFTGIANFQGVRFCDVSFTQSEFRSLASFERARFLGPASFVAIHGKEGSAFSLANAEFQEVPEFDQASFQKVPRLDNFSVEPGVKKLRSLEFSARWRALKGLAIDAHDHERERDFFAEEILSLRHAVDKALPWMREETVEVATNEGNQSFEIHRVSWPGGARFWFGVLYRGVSDFGRSIVRPFALWLVMIALFAWFYHAGHSALQSPHPPASSAAIRCIAGAGDPRLQALQLSFSKAFVVGGLIDANASFRTQACLFGITELKEGELKSRVVPNTPAWVTFLNALQVLISAALIFLFLMAVRNQFRIR